MNLTYAQNEEDRILLRFFPDRESGTFIDIGASAPVHENVTYALYLLGWRGINIDPIPERVRELERIRPHDHNILAAVGALPGQTELTRSPGLGGTSSIEPEIAARLSGKPGVHTIPVEVVTLRDICESRGAKDVQVLKIDVEGATRAVLEGADFARFRPELLVIEALDPQLGTPAHDAWEDLLIAADYRLAHDDGGNRYYIREESAHLADVFAQAPAGKTQPFSALGHPLENTDHPDHRWALTFAKNLLRSVSLESEAQLKAMYTLDIAPDLLGEHPGRAHIDLVYWRVLARAPRAGELADFEKAPITLGALFDALIASDEFRMRRGRSASVS